MLANMGFMLFGTTEALAPPPGAITRGDIALPDSIQQAVVADGSTGLCDSLKASSTAPDKLRRNGTAETFTGRLCNECLSME